MTLEKRMKGKTMFIVVKRKAEKRMRSPLNFLKASSVEVDLTRKLSGISIDFVRFLEKKFAIFANQTLIN